MENTEGNREMVLPPGRKTMEHSYAYGWGRWSAGSGRQRERRTARLPCAPAFSTENVLELGKAGANVDTKDLELSVGTGRADRRPGVLRGFTPGPTTETEGTCGWIYRTTENSWCSREMPGGQRWKTIVLIFLKEEKRVRETAD